MQPSPSRSLWVATLLALSLLPARAQFGNALSFDGALQFVTVPGFGAIAPTDEVTVEFWACANALGSQSAFMLFPLQPTNQFDALISFNDGNTYWDCGNIFTTGRNIMPNPATTISNWMHYALVASQSGNFMRIYTNGVLATNKVGMAPFARGSYELRLGGSTGFYLNGRLDDFRVWNVARSQAQIQANLANPLVGNEAGLLLYYKFDSSSGTVATNSATATGAAYNGTLVNLVQWVSSVDLIPKAVTLAATGVTTNSATLNGTVTQHAAVASGYYFQYGTTTNYGSTTAGGPALALPVSNTINNLLTGTNYHFRLVATNRVGTNAGADLTFIPLPDLPIGLGSNLAFNGVNQYVFVPGFGPIAPTREATVEFLAYAYAPRPSSTAFSISPPASTDLFRGKINSTDGTTYWEMGNPTFGGQLTMSSPLGTISNWVHYAFVTSLDGNFMRIYTNGVLAASKVGAFHFVPISGGLYIGGDPYTGFFNGRIEEFRVWNVARSAAEIQAGQLTPLYGGEPGLLLYFRFDEGSGTVATNSAAITGAAYNGYLNNGPLWTKSISLATTTLPATGVTPSSAVLNGIVNPVGVPTGCYFQYGTTTNYGNNSPVSTLAPGYAPIAVSNVLAGLPGTLHHFRLVATNSTGTNMGANFSFTPTTAPIVVTLAASSIAPRSVTLNGTVAPGQGASYYFEWDAPPYSVTTTPVSDLPASPGAVAVSNALTVLPGLLHHFRLVASNSAGVATGEYLTFTTPPDVPVVYPQGFSDVGTNSAKIYGLVGPAGAATDYHFQYGLTTNYGSATPTTSVGTLNPSVFQRNETVTGLLPGSLYHFRIVASNMVGTVAAPDVTFTTLGTSPVPPGIGVAKQSTTNLLFNITNGSPSGSWTLLTATNMIAPLFNWSTNRSGVFDAMGKVSLTNVINAAEAQRYYRVRTP